MGKTRWDIIGVGVAVFGLALVFIPLGVNVDKSLALGIGSVLLFVGLAITLIGTKVPRRISAAYWRWRNPRPASTPPLEGGTFGFADHPELPEEVFFTTNAREPRTVLVVLARGWSIAAKPGARGVPRVPTYVHFVLPEPQTIRPSDLPAEIRCKAGNARVTRFVPGGFVIDERGCIGDAFRAEVYFD